MTFPHTHILHLSDLHLGERSFLDRIRRRDTNLERSRLIVREIIYHFGAETHAVVISGDLMHHGKPEEARLAREIVRLLRLAGFLVIIVPGNHDFGPNGLRWSSASYSLWPEIYRDADRSWPRMHSDPLYPRMYTFDGWRLFALDTTAHKEDGQLFARGRVGPRQIAWLRTRLTNATPTVVVGHHCGQTSNPTLAMSDGDEVMKMLARPEVLYLHGHLHQERDHAPISGVRPRILECQKSTGHEELRIRVIDPKTGDFETFRRDWER